MFPALRAACTVAGHFAAWRVVRSCRAGLAGIIRCALPVLFSLSSCCCSARFPNLRLVDRTAFPKSSIVFSNIWGVADESLFDNALNELDRVHAAHKPFLAQIMTTTNHRPYSYPPGRIDIPSPGGRDGPMIFYAPGLLKPGRIERDEAALRHSSTHSAISF